MKKKIIVEEIPNLEKDLDSGAFLNRDKSAFFSRIRVKEAFKKQKEDYSNLEERLLKLEQFVESLTKK